MWEIGGLEGATKHVDSVFLGRDIIERFGATDSELAAENGTGGIVIDGLFLDPWLQAIVDFWTSRFGRTLTRGGSCSGGLASLDIEEIGHGKM